MKTQRNIMMVIALLLATAGAVEAQSYQSYFGADSTRLNVYVYCIDFNPTIYLLINSADTVNINGHDYFQGFPQGEYSDYFYYEDFYFREEQTSNCRQH